MSDAVIQAYIPSMATLIVVAIGVLYNNARISDLGVRLSDVSTGLNKRIDDLREENNRRFDRLEAQYARLEAVVIGKIDELEARLDNR